MSASDDFDWFNDSSVVQHDIQSLAIYPNNKGQIVIRQERSWDEEEDPFVRIDPRNARHVARVILDLALPARSSFRWAQPKSTSATRSKFRPKLCRAAALSLR